MWRKAGLTAATIVILVITSLLFLPSCGCGGKEERQASPSGGGDRAGGEVGQAGDIRRALLVIAPRDFQDKEYEETRKALEGAGYVVKTASIGTEPCRGVGGGEVRPDLALGEARAQDYLAVVFVGGAGAEVFFDHHAALAMAREAFEAGLTVGAICIAPVILARAGILSGRKATVYPSEAEELERGGAEYTGKAVEVDGKVVTADGPSSAQAFGKALVDNLAAP